MRPLHDEHRDTKTCNDADPCPTLRIEFEAFILPHLSMPRRGPKCKLGYQQLRKSLRRKGCVMLRGAIEQNEFLKVFHMCWASQRACPNSYRLMNSPITR